MKSIGQEVVTSHWDNRATSYHFNMNKDFFIGNVMEGWRNLFSTFIGDVGPLQVLDAGCGPAVLTRLLLDLGHQVTAVDVSDQMLQAAREVIGPDNDRVRFFQGDVADLPFDEGVFDLIINRYLVWTLPEPVKALREWRRLLRPGGRLCIIDTNWYYHYYRSRLNRWWVNTYQLYYQVRSGFNSGQKLATHYARDLPCTHVLRPHWDVGLLTGLDFENLEVYHDIGPQVFGAWSLNRLKNPWHRRFLVSGSKRRE